jgi:ribosomal-protein-alanine N-acetyltransferase
MSNSSPIIETHRLQLRLFEPSDAEQLYQLYSDPEVMRFMRGTRSRQQAEEHVQAFAEQYAKMGFTLWAVEQKADSQIIGRVGLWFLDGTEEVELGYLIAKSHWGRGLATEASLACLDFGFRQLALEFTAAIAVPENVASLRVMKKLGFKFVRKDRYYDMDVLYHRLERGEWLAESRAMQIRRATITNLIIEKEM